MTIRIFAVLTALVVAACGPVMETRQDFVPPASAAGMKCVQTCQTQQTKCQADENNAADRCRQKEDRRADTAYEKARDDYITALKLHAADATKYPMPVEPRRQPNYSACDVSSRCVADYQMCYRSCGGQINEYQVCVAGCE
jgi:hypothetical protein